MAMVDVFKRHDGVRALLDNRWIHLLALDENHRMAWRHEGNLQWSAIVVDSGYPFESMATGNHYSKRRVNTVHEVYVFLKLAGDFCWILGEIICRKAGDQHRVNRQSRHMETAQQFTIWALFARAALIVQIVIILLMSASVWCWAMITDKTIQRRKARVATDCSQEGK